MDDYEIYQSFLNRVEESEKLLIPIEDHAESISEYLISQGIEWSNNSEWFHIVWSIRNIKYDGLKKDISYGYCRPITLPKIQTGG